MKNKLSYICKFLRILTWPLLFGFGQVFITYIFINIYNSKIYDGFNNNSLYNEFLKTKEYSDGLNNYINSHLWMIILITIIIFLPIFYTKFKKYNNHVKLEKNIIYLILPSISITILLNLIIMNCNRLIGIQNISNDINMWVILLLSSGIVGPILEEFLFRGIVYNSLKKFNTNKISILLCTIIFALFHQSISQIIYAFIIGYILVKLYDKTSNLAYPIVFHMISNSIVVVLNNILVSMNLYYSLIFIFLFSLLFYISYIYMNMKIK